MGEAVICADHEAGVEAVTAVPVPLAGPFRVTTAQPHDCAPALAAAWRSLLPAQDPDNAVHQTQAYIEHLLDSGRSPEILVVHDRGEQVCGVVPVRRTGFVMSFG